MRLALFAALAGVVVAGTAQAAGRPMQTTAQYDWSGFYVGGDAGVFGDRDGVSNFFENDSNPKNANDIQTQRAFGSSFVGGAHAGFNWRIAPYWIAGVEGDWQRFKPRGTICRETDEPNPPCVDLTRGFATIDDEAKWVATLRGRIGWTFENSVIYGTAGAAYGDVRTKLGLSCLHDGCGNSNVPSAATSEMSAHKIGWVVGGGLEHLLDQNWMIRFEYLHIDLGSISHTLNLDSGNVCENGGPCGLSWSRALRYDIVRVGISYKFNSP